MARRARCYGSSGFYHVIMRGVDRCIIFEDEQDYRVFLSILKKCRKEEEVTICAYCLMSNHLHILLFSPPEKLSGFIKKIGVRYAAYFNSKYERVGHLFQDRYRSEPIDDEFYLLQAFRYILRNPEDAGLCATDRYPWSSYWSYGKTGGLTDTSAVCGLLGDFSAYSAFVADDSAQNPVMDYDSPSKHDDRWAIPRAKRLLNVDNLSSLRLLPKDQRDQAIRTLLSFGFSMRQISRITGFSRGLIERLSRQ